MDEKKVIKQLNEVIKIQRAEAIREKKQKGANHYMKGMANGLICARAIMTGKDPKYIG